MQDLEELNSELKKHLEETKKQLIKDIVQILKGENIDYLEGNGKVDIKALYFEYEYDYLDIVAWAVDKNGEIITDILKLPSQRKKQTGGSADWNSFLPENIGIAASEFQDCHEDEEDFDDLWDEYNEEKYELFEDWFCTCWKEASAQAEIRADAYFSVHDTYFKTDLGTFKTINDDEIAERYTSQSNN
ncbi:hypothetical protein B0A69_01730 [Chryseobacterium shigense]|uniref:DUF4303 domain-containing protein n=1 Tax=Chryseobacterium shigense TaxID=297244 RepID=A0A1N7IA28_9FLAO|nr:hypothetical protein [Chryseobacterium shigense]PQA96813.1 hypothetical protein B0A69_01730 [Chryseobacterium shigense]SIS33903.1 hypothetical protein SAMN05421639_102786 [Chryseobacterium shigense]